MLSISAQNRSSQFVISVRQPWAWLIVNGFKDVENRTWLTNYRGKIFIHAAQKFDKAGYEWVVEHFNIQLPAPTKFERGGIVGEAELVDCVTVHESPWFSGPKGFVLSEAHPIPFKELTGRLGIFQTQIPVHQT